MPPTKAFIVREAALRLSVRQIAAALAAIVCLPATVLAQLTLRLTHVPATTPSTATIYVAGSFNGWAPGAPRYALARAPDGSFVLTLPDSVRGAIEFKFTLGSWDRAETTPNGAAAPNRRAVAPPAGADTIEATVAGWSDPSRPSIRRHTASPSVSVLSDSFPMPQLGRTRRVWLYLPPGYATSTRRYPVLYMQDGQNVFDDATSFAGEWGVDEALDSLPRGRMQAIVVAVDHGGSRRLDEYDPWVNPDPKLGGGEGAAYADFLVHTLKPYVDAHYRTRADAAHTAVTGSSMGALIALYAALRYPETFGRAGLFSCATWITGEHLYEMARAVKPGRPRQRFFFVSGALETADGAMARDQRRMVDTLRAAGFHLGSDLRSTVSPDGRHSEWFWRREFPAVYRSLFEETPSSHHGEPSRTRASHTGAAR